MQGWYEATNNLELVASKALAKLTSLRLTYNSKGCVNAYIKAFSECILDLEHAPKPLSEGQKKTFFLNNIIDTAFGTKIDLSKEDATKTFTLEQIAQKGQDIEARRGPKTENRQFNQQSTGGRGIKGSRNAKNGGRGGNQGRGGDMTKHSDYIPPNQWDQMTPQQRKEVYEARKKGSANNDTESIPPLYISKQQQQTTTTNNDAASVITQSIAPTVRNIMQGGRANALAGCCS